MVWYRHPSGALVLSLAGLAIAVASVTCLAQPSSRKGPSHRGQASRLAPDVTGSIAAKPDGAKAATTNPADEEALPKPFYLPTAARSRVRACGEKWQQIKLSGHAAEMIWRDFATECLAAKAGPFDTRTQ